MFSQWLLVDVLASVWVVVSLLIGWSVPVTLLFLPKRKVVGGVRVVGCLITALLWPLMVLVLAFGLMVELFKSLKKGKMKW